MKTFKKVLALLLVAALAAGLAIVGTVAYLTHEDEEVNVFTVGNVEVELVEKQRNEAGNALEDFEDGKPLMPIVGSAQGTKDSFGMPTAANYVDKIVYARNVGASAAYMRIRIAVPTYENTSDTPTNPSTNNLHWNTPSAATQDKLTTELDGKVSGSAYVLSGDIGMKDCTITIDGCDYTIYTFTFEEPIAPGFATKAVMSGLYLDKRVDYNPESGMYEDINGKEFYIRNNTVNIPVIVEAIQADGFASATDAFNAANFPENPWDVAEKITYDSTNPDYKSFKDFLKKNLTGSDTVVDAANAGEVNLDYGLNTTMVPEGTTVTIKNATVVGQNYGNAVAGTVIFENCTFTNDWAYSIHFDAGSGNVIFRNCTLDGWCSFGTAIKSVEMYNCKIGGNNIFAMHRFYQDTVMVNCTIDCSDANQTDDYTDGISAVAGATVTMIDCEYANTDWEVSDNGKIISDGVVLLESINGSYELVEN